MTKYVSFKLSFKIFQWILVLIIIFSTFLGYQFYKINIQAQKTENKRLWLVTKLNQYHSRTDSLSFFAEQYISSSELSYLEQYHRLRQKKIRLVYNINLPVKSTSHTAYQPFVSNEKRLIKQIVDSEFRLRELERISIVNKERQLKGYRTFIPINNKLTTREYTSLNLNLVALIEKVISLVHKRYQQEISNLEAQRSNHALAIPGILVLNLILLFFSFYYMNRRMDQYHRELKSLTLKDFLTGAHNRKYLMEAGPLLLGVNKREATQVAVIMLDIDHFKKINDQHGHSIGDQVLKLFCDSISIRIRQGDIFSRIGGEEFVLLLNNVNAGDAEHYANELRSMLSCGTFKTQQHIIEYTVSMGIAMSDGNYDLAELLCLADSALYQAKKSGRNKVVMYEEGGNIFTGVTV
ncbi:MAG: hypothetical protein OFPII_14640 [Osedax symbiont Rs1]|nr:MAG: hypothetical protein OFPII_14640 [Osedax symbiont Rs1]